MPLKDKVFCKSPGCTNKCGNKMSYDELKELDILILDSIKNFTDIDVTYDYFCKKPDVSE